MRASHQMPKRKPTIISANGNEIEAAMQHVDDLDGHSQQSCAAGPGSTARDRPLLPATVLVRLGTLRAPNRKRSQQTPLTRHFSVGLTGFEPATP